MAIFLCNCSPSTDKANKEEDEAEYNDLPKMKITLVGGSELNMRAIEGKAVLIFYMPDCDHCQREAVEIRENLGCL